MSRALALRTWFEQNLPQYTVGVEETRALDPERFDRLAEQFLSWAEGVLGSSYLDTVARSYARFTTSVNFHQVRYEASGRYEATRVEEFHQELYQADERMSEYLWGVYLTLFLWPHHLRLARFYEEMFLPRLSPESRFIELAFGHGGWGLWALSRLPQATLTGLDIAPSSVKIASSLATSAGLESRTSYSRGDALVKPDQAAFEAAVCGFVIEHLETPSLLLEALAAHLKPGGWLFLTGALTAAQEDHIFEFRAESELVTMAEAAGFRALATCSEGPPRLLPKARFMPRSMALILVKKQGEFF